MTEENNTVATEDWNLNDVDDDGPDGFGGEDYPSDEPSRIVAPPEPEPEPEPEPAPKPKAKKKRPSPKKKFNAADIAASQEFVDVTVRRVKPSTDSDGHPVGVGTCGQFANNPATLYAEIEEQCGGGVYKISGMTSDGEPTSWTETIAGEPKPIGSFVAYHERLQRERERQEAEEEELELLSSRRRMAPRPPWGGPADFFSPNGPSVHDPRSQQNYMRAKELEKELERARADYAAQLQREKDLFQSKLEAQREKFENELKHQAMGHKHEIERMQDKLDMARQQLDEEKRKFERAEIQRENDKRYAELQAQFAANAAPKEDPLSKLLPILMKSNDERSKSEREMLASMLQANSNKDDGLEKFVAMFQLVKDTVNPPEENDPPMVAVAKQGAEMVAGVLETRRQELAMQQAQAQAAILAQHGQPTQTFTQPANVQTPMIEAKANPPQPQPAQPQTAEEEAQVKQIKTLTLLRLIVEEFKNKNDSSYSATVAKNYARSQDFLQGLVEVTKTAPEVTLGHLKQALKNPALQFMPEGKTAIENAIELLQTEEGVSWWKAFSAAVGDGN